MLIRDRRIVYRKELGYADLDARTLITRDTQFDFASMTRQFTAMVIMILKERGKLRLEDTLAKFCFEFPAYASTITIRHLLNHTSGLPNYEEILLGKGGKVVTTSSTSPRRALVECMRLRPPNH